ncbi:MAG: M15 family metallopeptidase [Acidimicrobiia bacterium]
MWILGAALLGVVAGAAAVVLVPRSAPEPTTLTPAGSATVGVPTTSAAPASITSAPTGTAGSTADAQPEAALLVVWTSGGLPPGLADAVNGIDGVALVSEIRSDLIWLESTTTPGLVVPLEATAVDEAYATLASAEWAVMLEGLTPDHVILGESSAKLRGLASGALVMLSGRQFTVAGEIPDVVVGASEAVMTVAAGAQIGVTTSRYLLVAFEGDRARFERTVRERIPTEIPTRIRAPGETPFLRHGDAVLPQVLIKEQFGEFGVRLTGEGGIQIEPEWIDANLATVELPLLGETTCHVGILSSLRGAIEELEHSNLGFLVESFDGCYNPRFIGGSRSLSRHAWGVAIDLNYAANPTGQVTVQDPRLVSVLERWGFTWGGNWLVPDPAHFEWVSPPLP